MDEDILRFIEDTNLSIDAINDLYAGYSKLQKAGIEITKEQYHDAINSALLELDSDLSNMNQVIQANFGYMLEHGENFTEQ